MLYSNVKKKPFMSLVPICLLGASPSAKYFQLVFFPLTTVNRSYLLSSLFLLVQHSHEMFCNVQIKHFYREKTICLTTFWLNVIRVQGDFQRCKGYLCSGIFSPGGRDQMHTDTQGYNKLNYRLNDMKIHEEQLYFNFVEHSYI